MMINKRLIGTVSESKKYIVGNVICQWCSLVANIVMMTAITKMPSCLGYLSSKAVKKTLREMLYKKLLKLGSSYKEKVQTSE